MDQTFEMTIGSDIREIPAVSRRLEDTMGAYGFSSEDILDTQLAVEEVVTNIIVHGYKKAGCPVEISWRFIPGAVTIRISDSAPPFDPLSIPEPDLGGDIEKRRIGGLGIYLLRQIMDGISYRCENGKNLLTLEKRKAS